MALVWRELLTQGMTLRKELAPALHAVFADRVQLQQALIDLVINGIEAMQAISDRPRELLIGSHREDLWRVVVTVQDNGLGISVEDVDRLFTAFFTTRSGGMGMGLSICRSIIEAHGGRLWATRNIGPGATFQISLEAHDPAAS
jgi:signal transduction histidine kinase